MSNVQLSHSLCFNCRKSHDHEIETYGVCHECFNSQANKIGKINLAATGKDLMEDEKPGDVTVDLFAALDMETEAVSERSSELENSQTLGLLMGFLAVDDWYFETQNLSFFCCFCRIVNFSNLRQRNLLFPYVYCVTINCLSC